MIRMVITSLFCIIAIASSAEAIDQERPLSEACWAKAHDKNDAVQICSRQIRDRGLRGRDLAELYSGRGFAYVRSDNFAAAIRDYDKALKLWPGSSSIHFGRAMAYALSGDMDRATDDYAQVVALNPRYLASFEKRALELEAMGGKYEVELERAYSLSFLLRLVCRAHPATKQVCPSDITGHPEMAELCMICGPPQHLAALHN